MCSIANIKENFLCLVCKLGEVHVVTSGCHGAGFS